MKGSLLKDTLLALFDSAIQKKSNYPLDHLFLSAIVRSRRDLSIFQGKIDTVEIADEIKIGVLIGKDQRWGCSTLEQAREDLLAQSIRQACEASSFGDADPNYSLAKPSLEKKSTLHATDLTSVSMKLLEEKSLEMEKRAQIFSPLIRNIPQVGCGYETLTRVICNSEGVRVVEESGNLHAGISVMAAGKDERMVNVSEMGYWSSPSLFNTYALASEISEEAVKRTCPREIQSGNYPILFDPRSAAHLLSAFWSIFSGDLLYRKLSKLEGKLGQKIASSLVSISDSGPLGLTPHFFDAEGSVCLNKFPIREGIFETFLHNRYTGKKAGSQTTGNAGGGLGSPPNLSPANLSWEGTTCPQKEILQSIKKGVWVKELAGASASPISGDFSYGALGYWVENGEVQYPVADFTLAGNFFELLSEVEKIGEDLEWISPHALGSYGGRSLLVNKLAVSGK